MAIDQKVELPKLTLYHPFSIESSSLAEELNNEGYSINQIFSGAEKPVVLFGQGVSYRGYRNIRLTFTSSENLER